MHPRPFRVPVAKGATLPRSGQVTAKLSVLRREQDGTETVVHETEPRILEVPSNVDSQYFGVSGLSYGLTIPGPEKSYMAARIDVFSSLPHGASVEEAREVIRQCSELVQEQLEVEAKEANEFFSSFGHRK